MDSLLSKQGEGEANIPAAVDGFAFCAGHQLFHGTGAYVLEVIGAGARDDGIPNDRGISDIFAGRPLGGDVYEDLLCIPGEEARQIGVEGEPDNGVLLLLGAVVMRPPPHTAQRRRQGGASMAQRGTGETYT